MHKYLTICVLGIFLLVQIEICAFEKFHAFIKLVFVDLIVCIQISLYACVTTVEADLSSYVFSFGRHENCRLSGNVSFYKLI